MNSSTKLASVIIPAYNEENLIGNTLKALMVNESLEVIVVDNGSTDSTAKIVREYGATLVDFPEGTIAAVRNRGVQEANTDVFVFIDADITVAPDWHENLQKVAETLRVSPMMVTGSRVRSSAKQNVLNKYWYSQLTSYSAPYINSGHMITSRNLFEKINGFDEDLSTAEDYAICQAAKAVGARIYNDPQLVVVHDGYPETLLGFIRRERWHGGQDVEDINSFIASKIAWFAGLNLCLVVIAIVASAMGNIYFIPLYFAVMYGVSLLLTMYKFGLKKVKYMLLMPVLFYFYLCGRTLALIDRLVGKKIK